ncbi:hypothetical protein DPMN_187712 [Dreissena polymorpha]|uniref:Uncharacterized protein n=1 Tax=Dreissena polymorpha TaxID=45954 RepID=A0A9D4DS43_DREPO|nr:hypothetical protein DPMN_187712 [Dreissena polymorpha]
MLLLNNDNTCKIGGAIEKRDRITAFACFISEACWSTVAKIILANQNTDLESGERIGYSKWW